MSAGDFQPVVLLCPMLCESDLLLSVLCETGRRQTAGFIFHEGTLCGVDTVLVQCMMGTANAAAATALACVYYQPRSILLAGTAGAHDPALEQNDIVVAERVVSIVNYVTTKRGIGEGSDPFSWEKFGIQTFLPGEEEPDFSHEFPCDPALVSLALSVPYEDGRVRRGRVGAGDVWNREADLLLHLHKTYGTDCEAMEGSGAAQLCRAFGVPFLEIRVISNNELHPNELFSKNTAQSCQRFVLGFLTALWEMGKP